MPIMAPLSQFAGVPRLPGRHSLPGCQRAGEPGHTNFSSGHGRPGYCPGGIRHLVEVRLAGAGAFGRPVDRGAGRGSLTYLSDFGV